jgi:hypothetical protein
VVIGLNGECPWTITKSQCPRSLYALEILVRYSSRRCETDGCHRASFFPNPLVKCKHVPPPSHPPLTPPRLYGQSRTRSKNIPVNLGDSHEPPISCSNFRILVGSGIVGWFAWVFAAISFSKFSLSHLDT